MVAHKKKMGVAGCGQYHCCCCRAFRSSTPALLPHPPPPPPGPAFLLLLLLLLLLLRCGRGGITHGAVLATLEDAGAPAGPMHRSISAVRRSGDDGCRMLTDDDGDIRLIGQP